ncbi:unnamed protein product [Peronospora belbahrii]|uniref:Uncharacterized protein n=1 Tax=Peronospora belbahrii TaxID=622444 RepID=A0AAU9KT90_9STRA|nr:unnamed protein product [Peronospora belbahrii]
MGGNVAYVELFGASSKATLGLYAGIQPQELDVVVRTALRHYDGVCTGFQVTQETPRSSRKKRHSRSIPRLVPLSVACKAPELLIGHVCALFAPFASSQTAWKAENEAITSRNDVESLQKLLQALESEEKLSGFEFAMLQHLCEQQNAQVLAVMNGTLSVDKKKEFLLQMLHPKDGEELQMPRNQVHQQKEKKTLYGELVAKKVAVIGTKAIRPQVQKQILALADEIRQNWKTDATKNKFIDTIELLTIVEKLLDQHMLSEEHGTHLLELIVGENKMLWSALQSYRKDGGSLLGLKAMAKRLAAAENEPSRPITSKKSKGKGPRKGTRQGNFLVRKRVRNAPAVAATTSAAVAAVTSLHAQHLLTSLELDIIKALIEQEDSQVLHTLRAFKQSDYRNVGALRDALVSIVEDFTMEFGDEEKAAAAFACGMGDAVREDSQWKDSDDDSGLLEWQRHLSFLLGQWQCQQELTPADASALRKLVFQRHNLLESAYEAYAADGDASELLDTLQRVAKLQRQIEQCQTGQNGLNGVPASDVSLEDVVREMQLRGVLQSGDAAGLLVLFHGENEALKAANEAFQADGDVHELEETLLLVVKHAHFGREMEEGEPVDEGQAVCRLLADLGRSERLELWQIQLLISLLKSHDPRLLAAVDVYHEDQETNELVETLAILVELAAWERHRRAMVHDWIPPLARSGKLSRVGAARLVEMVNVRDDRVIAALVVFLSDNNKEEFVDTLARIASLETMKLLDAEAAEKKEGYLLLALLKELKEKGTMSATERKQFKELMCSVEPQMVTALDLSAVTHDATDLVDIARRVLVKVQDHGDIGEKRELEEDESFSEAPVSSLVAEQGTIEEESFDDDDAKEDVLDAQVPVESHEDTFAGAEAQVKCESNELTEQQETEKTEQEEKNIEEINARIVDEDQEHPNGYAEQEDEEDDTTK